MGNSSNTNQQVNKIKTESKEIKKQYNSLNFEHHLTMRRCDTVGEGDKRRWLTCEQLGATARGTVCLLIVVDESGMLLVFIYLFNYIFGLKIAKLTRD